MEFNAERISVISTRIQNYFNIGMLWSYVWGSHVSVLFRIVEMIFRKHLRRKMPESQTLKDTSNIQNLFQNTATSHFFTI